MKQNGFSMIEAIVVISIIGFITTVSIVNFKRNEYKNSLSAAANQIVSDIRRVQNFSLGALASDPFSRYEWGIYFKQGADHYIIFKDNGNKEYNSDNDIIFETVSLPQKCFISSQKIDVIFIPPDPIIYINKSTTTSSVIEIKSTIGEEKKIYINTVGLVEVK